MATSSKRGVGSRKRSYVRVDDEVFVATWAVSEGLWDVAQKLRIPYRSAESKAYRLRRAGVELPAWRLGAPPKARGIAKRIERLRDVLDAAARSAYLSNVDR